MARAFVKSISPDSMISPAEVQGYLMIHRQDPQAALDGVSAFAAEIIETKRRGANVAKHANETDRAGRDTGGDVDPGDAREDCASDTDQSGGGDDCGCRGMDQDCECAAVSSNDDVKVEATLTEKRKPMSEEELGSGLLSQVLSLLHMVT